MHASPSHCQIQLSPPVQGNQTCNTFGNDLIQGSAPSGVSGFLESFGLFVSTSTPTNCAGNATGWNICYYDSTTDVPSTARFGVYRISSGSMYNLVPGSTTSFTISQSVSGYMCSSVTLPQNSQFTVLPGDLLAACLQAPKLIFGSGRLGVVGSVTGLSILQASSTACGTLANSVDTSVSADNGYTTHINLGMASVHVLLSENVLMFPLTCSY